MKVSKVLALLTVTLILQLLTAQFLMSYVNPLLGILGILPIPLHCWLYWRHLAPMAAPKPAIVAGVYLLLALPLLTTNKHELVMSGIFGLILSGVTLSFKFERLIEQQPGMKRMHNWLIKPLRM